MATLHSAHEWPVNPVAEDLHHQGLNLSTALQLKDARHNYGLALEALDNDQPSDSLEVQRSRIERDYGFTFVREILTPNSNLSDEFIDSRIGYARDWMEGSNRILTKVLETPHQPLTATETAGVYAERGASKALLGRAVVAQQVKLDDIRKSKPTPLERKALRDAQKDFGKAEAHGDLTKGSNMYYLVSNAMHAARAERLNSSRKLEYAYMGPWLGRAAVGLLRSEGKMATVGKLVGQAAHEIVDVARTRSVNPRARIGAVLGRLSETETGTAILTAGRIGWSMRSRRAAIASIKARP